MKDYGRLAKDPIQHRIEPLAYPSPGLPDLEFKHEDAVRLQ